MAYLSRLSEPTCALRAHQLERLERVDVAVQVVNVKAAEPSNSSHPYGERSLCFPADPVVNGSRRNVQISSRLFYGEQLFQWSCLFFIHGPPFFLLFMGLVPLDF